MENRPGWQTSEFYVTIAMTLIALLVNVGVLTLADSKTMEEAIKQIAASVTTLVAAATTIWKFIESRRSTKVANSQAVAAIAMTAPGKSVADRVEVAKVALSQPPTQTEIA